MDKRLQEKLYADFPEFFYEKDLPATKTSMCFGCQCGDGWFRIINNTCVRIKRCENNKSFRFVQIKEKSGGLCMYGTGGTPEIYKILSEMEQLSYSVCEECESELEFFLDDEGYWGPSSCPKCSHEVD